MFKKTEKAFTLVEVLVSMVVLAIGLLGLAGITIIVLRSNTLSQQISEATTISTSLMESLKRQSVTSLPDCTNVISPSSSCSILLESGLQGLSNSLVYYPAASNGSAGCGVAGVIDTNALSFDVVNANLVTASTYSDSATICDLSSATLSSRQYVRYYRTYQPSGGSSSDRTIAVVVLWKDRFGKWRNVHFMTTRTY